MRKNPHKIELQYKEVLTVEECAVLTGIGQLKLQALLDQPDCPFRLLNGRKRMILKNKFFEYLEEKQQI